MLEVVTGKKTAKGVMGSIKNRIGKFKTLADETRKDIASLNGIKADNEKKMSEIADENTAIENQVAEGEAFVDALENMIGVKSEKSE